MIELQERIEAFTQLGQVLNTIDNETLESLIARARASNSWFTEDSVKQSLEGIKRYLDGNKLNQWASRYPIRNQNLKVGIVMAGNIPLVGFHDLLSVVMSGNQAHLKLSSQDMVLIQYIIDKLREISPKLVDTQVIVRDQLKDIDAIIATGSDNTSRYFNYYFGKYPNIIRKNRTSCAILNGNESREELELLADDIFTYFGLGCRNVAKLFVPTGYKFDQFFEATVKYNTITYHHKYNNNYDYNKSIYLVNGIPHLDNGYLMLKEDHGMVSPISVVFYEEYTSGEHLQELLDTHRDKIQCIVSSSDEHIAFGNAQQPELWDYADNVDTMKFLIAL